jgi:hypothetical protein
MLPDRPQVEIHADGDEEQPEQHVAERLDVLLDLIAILGLGDEHPGEKRTERERKPCELAKARRARASPAARSA